MESMISTEKLDEILAFQLTVAWAGEGACDPPRLGWWRTDLVDPRGGGDLFARLLPKTHEWASLEAVREAARRKDQQVRAMMPDPDKLRTLFFFGFRLDERLDERLRALKFSDATPSQSLSLPFEPESEFSTDMLADLVKSGGGGAHTIVPNGRRMKGAVPGDSLEMARNLAAALIPLHEQYPMPFYEVK